MRKVLPRLVALAQVALPGEEGIGPAAHGVFVAAERLDAERAGPVIVAQEFHGRDVPLSFIFFSEKQFSDDRVVAVGEDVGLDDHVIAHGALRGIAPAIDLRTDRLDDDALRRVLFIQA